MANLEREQSAALAVSELNAAGGLASASSHETSYPLILVACDASDQPLRAAAHLVDTLKVPAIVGPNNSQNTLEIARNVTVPGGTVTISPTAVAASIVDLRDGDLAWQMVPSDAQRAPLLIYKINALERELKQRRQRNLRLGVILRGDVLGDRTRTELAKLTWNGEPFADLVSNGIAAIIDTYDGDESNQDELVAKYAAFAPDLLVLVGAGEAVSGIIAPLERARIEGEQPEYLLTDSSKVPELLSLVEAQPELAARVRGIGVTPSEQASAVNQAFQLSYNARYPDAAQALSSGMGPSYDATYAIAYAIVAEGGDVTGHDVARGLRRLGRGERIPLGPAHILSAFRHLVSGESIAAIGTYSTLAWDDRGAVSAGLIEIWCVDLVDGRPAFTSSGLTAEIPTQTLRGEDRGCGVRANAAPVQPSTNRAVDGGMQQPDAAMNEPSPDAATPRDTKDPTSPAPPDAATPSASLKPIPCGPHECQHERGEYCCIAVTRPFGNFDSDFSCESTPRSCAASLRCTSDRECEHGAICCKSTSVRETRCVAATSCGDEERHLACDAPADCPTNQECCLDPGTDSSQWSSSCKMSCRPGTTGALRMCSRQSQCSTPNGCQRWPDVPTVGTCQ